MDSYIFTTFDILFSVLPHISMTFLGNVTKYTFQHKMLHWAINTIFIGLQTSYVLLTLILLTHLLLLHSFFTPFFSAKKKRLEGRESLCVWHKSAPSLYLSFACDWYRYDERQIHTQSSFLLLDAPCERVRIFPIINLCSRSIDTYNVIINFSPYIDVLSQVTHRLFIIYMW